MSGVYLDQQGELQGALVTSGHRMMLICVAVAKMALRSEMPAALRLRFLEILDALQDHYVKAEMVAMIEPMPDEAWQIVNAALSLNPKTDDVKSWQDIRPAWNILEGQRVFGFLLKLNPSMLEAIRWREIDYPAECRDRMSPEKALSMGLLWQRP